jgi:hypothetical protein
MKCLILLVLVGVVACETNKLSGKFVFDLLKPALSAAEVNTLIGSRDAGYPKYNSIPDTKFSCGSKAQPGFYADVEAQCQVFHRCDQAGNLTSYLCVNTTIFNQITLVCDSWYNVECSRSADMENFANSRLYTELPLFDSPPADYVSPSQLVQLQNQGLVAQQIVRKPVKRELSSGSSSHATLGSILAGKQDVATTIPSIVTGGSVGSNPTTTASTLPLIPVGGSMVTTAATVPVRASA